MPFAFASEELHAADVGEALQAATMEHASGHQTAQHGSGGLPQLDPSTFETQLIWLFIVFTFLYMFFSKRSLPEVRTVIENRHERIQNDLDTAGKLKSEAETVRKHYEESLLQAQDKAAQIFSEVEESIRIIAESGLKDFSEKSANQLVKLESDLKKVKDNALKEMDSMSMDIGKAAAEKILGDKIKSAKAA